MGRKKSKRSRKPPVKRIRILETVFDCPFCSHEKSCSVRMDQASSLGKVACCECREEFQTQINHLSAPIDVYSDWIDACETVNQ